MAEYYPLISRAVAGLRNGTPEARRAIYDRAKSALVTQLRSMQPPIPEEAIARETTALEDAVARVEAEVGPRPASPPVEPPSAPPIASAPVAPPPVPVKPPVAPAPAPEVRPAENVSAPSPVAGASAPPAGGTSAPTIGGVQRPAAPTLPTSRQPTLRPSAPRTIPPRPTVPVARPSAGTTKAPERPEPAAPGEAKDENRRAAAPATPAALTPAVAPPVDAAIPATLPAAPILKVAPDENKTTSGMDGPATPSDATVVTAQAPRIDEDAARPAAPRHAVEKQRPSLRIWIVAMAALAAVVAVAFTAWRLRDNPDDLSKTPAVTQATPPIAGKVAERADATNASSAAGASTAADQTAPADQATPAPDAANNAAGQQTATTSPAPATQSSVDPAVPIAYKAAILVDAPDDPQKVKTYVGTVVWRNENVNQGQDQPLGNAVRADVDIPDAKIQLVVTIRKNVEPQFPASHTIELKFTVAADSPVGPIKQIDVPQLRREDMPTGDPLSGIPATITSNYFLVGLTRGPPEKHNLDLISSRAWFDIPMLLESGKPAKVTFEKGTAGTKILDAAIQAWSGTPN